MNTIPQYSMAFPSYPLYDFTHLYYPVSYKLTPVQILQSDSRLSSNLANTQESLSTKVDRILATTRKLSKKSIRKSDIITIQYLIY